VTIRIIRSKQSTTNLFNAAKTETSLARQQLQERRINNETTSTQGLAATRNSLAIPKTTLNTKHNLIEQKGHLENVDVEMSMINAPRLTDYYMYDLWDIFKEQKQNPPKNAIQCLPGIC